MPREGYRTICVTDEVYNYIKQRAAETNRTIPEYIKNLIEQDTEAPQKHSPTSTGLRLKSRKKTPEVL